MNHLLCRFLFFYPLIIIQAFIGYHYLLLRSSRAIVSILFIQLSVMLHNNSIYSYALLNLMWVYQYHQEINKLMGHRIINLM